MQKETAKSGLLNGRYMLTECLFANELGHLYHARDTRHSNGSVSGANVLVHIFPNQSISYTELPNAFSRLKTMINTSSCPVLPVLDYGWSGTDAYFVMANTGAWHSKVLAALQGKPSNLHHDAIHITDKLLKDQLIPRGLVPQAFLVIPGGVKVLGTALTEQFQKIQLEMNLLPSAHHSQGNKMIPMFIGFAALAGIAVAGGTYYYQQLASTPKNNPATEQQADNSAPILSTTSIAVKITENNTSEAREIHPPEQAIAKASPSQKDKAEPASEKLPEQTESPAPLASTDNQQGDSTPNIQEKVTPAVTVIETEVTLATQDTPAIAIIETPLETETTPAAQDTPTVAVIEKPLETEATPPTTEQLNTAVVVTAPPEQEPAASLPEADTPTVTQAEKKPEEPQNTPESKRVSEAPKTPQPGAEKPVTLQEFPAQKPAKETSQTPTTQPLAEEPAPIQLSAIETPQEKNLPETTPPPTENTPDTTTDIASDDTIATAEPLVPPTTTADTTTPPETTDPVKVDKEKLTANGFNRQQLIEKAYAAIEEGKLSEQPGSGSIYYIRLLKRIAPNHHQVRRLAREVVSAYHINARNSMKLKQSRKASQQLWVAGRLIEEFKLNEMNKAHLGLIQRSTE
uniref:Uncharacterized protein n=1 Tax=uncultured Thiotrichaceae bacterium TaxID=298394 RepID=A0A6S6TEZ8_9GAMM|nr:MAG: Unknown protein [uncultured Thiotrichaceae bacterium]